MKDMAWEIVRMLGGSGDCDFNQLMEDYMDGDINFARMVEVEDIITALCEEYPETKLGEVENQNEDYQKWNNILKPIRLYRKEKCEGFVCIGEHISLCKELDKLLKNPINTNGMLAVVCLGTHRLFWGFQQSTMGVFKKVLKQRENAELKSLRNAHSNLLSHIDALQEHNEFLMNRHTILRNRVMELEKVVNGDLA